MTRLILNWLLVFVLLATTIFAVPESVAESQKMAAWVRVGSSLLVVAKKPA